MLGCIVDKTLVMDKNLYLYHKIKRFTRDCHLYVRYGVLYMKLLQGTA